MTTTTIPTFLLAPGPNLVFAAAPSGQSYAASAASLVTVTNGSVADIQALVNAGCVVLSPTLTNITTLNFTTPVAAATTGALPANAYSNGTLGVGATLTGTANGALAAQDGVTLTLNQRLWVKNEGAAANNGIYVVTQVGSGSAPYILTRSTDADTAAELGNLAAFVTGGATNIGNVYAIPLSFGAITVGTTAIEPVQVNGPEGVATETARAEVAEQSLYTLQMQAIAYLWADDGGTYTGGLFDISGYPILATTASGALVGSITGINVATEQTRAEAAELSLYTLQMQAIPYLWADDGGTYTGGLFDESGYPILATTSSNTTVGSAVTTLSTTGYIWADDPLFGLVGDGVAATTDANGNLIAPLGAMPAPIDDYCPYINKPDGSLRATDNSPSVSGLDLFIASTRGNPSTGGISGVHQMGAIVKFMDDATASGNAPYHERRQFDYRAGNYLANIGGITKLVHVIDIGHSLTVGATAGLLTTAAFFPRGVMFNGGPKVVQGTGSTLNWSTPAPVCDDEGLQSLAEYYEFQDAGGQGETHGGGAVQWASAGNIGATESLLFSSVGAGGAILANLLSGTNQFGNMLRVAERSAAIAAFNGWGWECYVTCSIGENDYLTYASNAATFQANLIAMQASIQTAIKGIFTNQGWSAPAYVPLICLQPSSWTENSYNLTTCALAYVFPALVRAYPNDFVLVGPEYYTDHYTPGGGGSSIHKTAAGYKLDGQYMMRTIAKIRASAATPGLYVMGVSNSGTALTITTNATTNLAIDTSIVSDPGQSGLRVLDVTGGNANIALSGISVSGSTISATLASHTPGNTYMLGVGDIGTAGNLPGPTTGPRTTIRDSSADVSSGDTGSTDMYNYLSHDQLTWTAA